MSFSWPTISKHNKNQLLNAPALLIIYATNHYSKISPAILDKALDYYKITVISAPTHFTDYFNEITRDLNQNIKQLQEELPKRKMKLKKEIIKKLIPINNYLNSLNNRESEELKQALFSFVGEIYFTYESILHDKLYTLLSKNKIKRAVEITIKTLSVQQLCWYIQEENNESATQD